MCCHWNNFHLIWPKIYKKSECMCRFFAWKCSSMSFQFHSFFTVFFVYTLQAPIKKEYYMFHSLWDWRVWAWSGCSCRSEFFLSFSCQLQNSFPEHCGAHIIADGLSACGLHIYVFQNFQDLQLYMLNKCLSRHTVASLWQTSHVVLLLPNCSYLLEYVMGLGPLVLGFA
jgi:hypothetical protein